MHSVEVTKVPALQGLSLGWEHTDGLPGRAALLAAPQKQDLSCIALRAAYVKRQLVGMFIKGRTSSWEG